MSVNTVNSAPSDWSGTEIAIVGAAGRFPGARTLAEFWQLLRDGRESIRVLSQEELDAAGVSRAMREHPQFVNAAAVLDDIGWWDAKFWGFSPKDAAIMDPQHRLFLECAYEALEHAGIAPDQSPGRIGVYAGVGNGTWFQRTLLHNQALMEDVGFFLVRHTGNDKDFLATRVSYELDLRGPSINVQTACSTSLVAIHLASQALLSGETDVALAGGVTIELPNTAGYLFKENEILSPDGHCRAFDAEAAGTVFGSGAGVVVLRRLQDALDDRDNILAVIRGSAINNDGAGKIGYLAPSVDGQAEAIAEAIDVAGVTADTIDYVEAHGTGTRVGDPIEVAALSQAFRRTTTDVQYCTLGSIKTNIGHLDTAAGVAGVIKVMLAMQHGEIPATVHYRAPNPLIDFASTPFVVRGERQDWGRRGHARRAGVSSLGVGGTNAHLVLEEAPPSPPSPPATRALQLLPVSARTETALTAAVTNLADHLRDDGAPALADAAWTLQTGRLAHPHRTFVVASSLEEAATQLESADAMRRDAGTAASTRAVAFLFAGGGAQHAAMARTLYQREPVFREVFDAALAALDGPVARDVRAVLLGNALNEQDAAAQLERPSIGLPALLITQIALAKLWQHWGVHPATMIGHSMGEYAAAHLAGVFTLTDVVRLVALRGRLFEQVEAGSMLSVSLSPEALTPLLPPMVSIAVINGPALCVASGPTQHIQALEALLIERQVECRRIRIAVAAHSVLLDPILGEFERFLRSIPFGRPSIPFASNRSGQWITRDEATDPMYWVRHLRETVNFASGLELLLQDPDCVLLEVGPGRTLTQLASMHPTRRESHRLVNSLPPVLSEGPALDDQVSLLSALGALWVSGVPVTWRALHGEAPGKRVPLPTYPWERQRYWMEPDAVASATPSSLAASGTDAAAIDDDTRAPAVDAWLYEPTWKRTDAPAPASVERLWVLADYGDTLLDGVLATLSATGTTVTMVQPGERFAATATGYTVRVDEADDWLALCEQTMAAGQFPTHIVHALVVAAAGLPKQMAAFGSLAALGQALGRLDPSPSFSLVVLTEGAHEVTGDDLTSPDASMVLGPVLGLPAEVEGLTARTVDLDASSRAPRMHVQMVQRLAREIAVAHAESVVAFRAGRRWSREFRAVATGGAPLSPTVPVREHGVYVITGGLGGIGLALAEWLAQQAHVHLVLVSRRGLPPAGAGSSEDEARRDAVRRLEGHGATVQVAAADVTDAAQVASLLQAVQQQYGGMHGVIHAAGALADGLLSFKTPSDMAAVMAPKVLGLQSLAAGLSHTPLDFWVCCSSVSAMAGLPGQIDYAAANAYLDAWCVHHAAQVSYPVLSLAWSAWRDAGMVARVRGQNDVVRRPHPLLERTLRDGDDALFATTLDPSRHWMMDEHRLVNGPSLVPGTGYLEIARAALSPWATGATLELYDVAFLSPLVLTDDAPREMRVSIETSAQQGRFLIAGAVAPGEDGSTWEEHVVGEARRIQGALPAPVDLAGALARCTRGTIVPGVDPHVAFGPRWHNIQSLALGDGMAVLSLALAPAYHADLTTYALHPALMDMATAGAQQLIPGYNAQTDFFVPLSYGRLTMYAPLTAQIHSVVTLRDGDRSEQDLAAFDVIITDANGVVLVEIEEFLMTRVRDLEQITGRDVRRRRRRSALDLETEREMEPAVAEPEWYQDAIRPAEGAQAFARALEQASVHPHLLVSPFSLSGLLRRLRTPQGVPTAAAASAPRPVVVPSLPLESVEAALQAQDAVHTAVVLQRADRTGSVRLVAYVYLHPTSRATVSELRRALRKALPAHLVPSVFLLLDESPVRSDGHVDREALPDPFGAEDDFVAPRSEYEQAIADVWRDVLGIERISVYDNFFDIGGHSLLAVRVITRLDKRLGVRLNQANMVLQTLEQLAAECGKRLAATGAGGAG